jgi:hypothetical protein
MNPYLQLAATVVAQLLVAAFIYGQLSQRVKDQTFTLGRHERTLDEHGKQLVEHGSQISFLEGSSSALPCLRDPGANCPHTRMAGSFKVEKHVQS